MNDVLIVLLPMLVVVAIGGLVCKGQRHVYEQLIRTIEVQRDKAEQEAHVYRGLLFPVLNKVENAPKVETRTVETPPGVPPQRRNLRISFRQLFNQARKLTNTSQQKTDALASAIEKIQEKKNA